MALSPIQVANAARVRPVKSACPNGGPAVILMAPVSPDYNYSWAQCGNIGGPVGTGCGATTLAADAAQGQTTIQVSSTSKFSVGQWVLIDEASGAGWVADPLNASTGYRKRVGRFGLAQFVRQPCDGARPVVEVQEWRRLGFWLDLPLSGKLRRLLVFLLRPADPGDCTRSLRSAPVHARGPDAP